MYKYIKIYDIKFIFSNYQLKDIKYKVTKSNNTSWRKLVMLKGENIKPSDEDGS